MRIANVSAMIDGDRLFEKWNKNRWKRRKNARNIFPVESEWQLHEYGLGDNTNEKIQYSLVIKVENYT